MDIQDNAQGTPGQNHAKRPYEPPRIDSETIFETTALACGKRTGQSGNCNRHPQNS
jgi:hypothetical protein